MEGSPATVPVALRGRVVLPTIAADVEALDFGPLSLNFPMERSVGIMNTSDVPIALTVAVPGDGALVAVGPAPKAARGHKRGGITDVPRELVPRRDFTLEGSVSGSIIEGEGGEGGEAVPLVPVAAARGRLVAVRVDPGGVLAVRVGLTPSTRGRD
jgi:hypothetical protein